MKNRSRKTINEVASCLKSVIPKTKRDTSMVKKCKTCLNNVTVFTLYGTVLLMSVGKGDSMSNSTFFKEFGGRSKFTSPVSLNGFYFKIKIAFNIKLELNKNGDCIIFVRNWK
jgi:hypothetical protein